MDEKQSILQSLGYEDEESCLNDIKKIIKELEYHAPTILNDFKSLIDKLGQEVCTNGHKRFVAEVEMGKDTLLKTPERILEKVIESHIKFQKWKTENTTPGGKKPQKYDLKKISLQMTDLVRFRIICNYLVDVYLVYSRTRKFIKESPDKYELKKRSDYIKTPFPERKAGHRALQYSIKYNACTNPFLFEVQVMTILEHAWDKKDHHLVYEYTRIGLDDDIPIKQRNRMAAMSELLYIADTVFDALKKSIQKTMKKKVKNNET